MEAKLASYRAKKRRQAFINNIKEKFYNMITISISGGNDDNINGRQQQHENLNEYIDDTYQKSPIILKPSIMTTTKTTTASTTITSTATSLTPNTAATVCQKTTNQMGLSEIPETTTTTLPNNINKKCIPEFDIMYSSSDSDDLEDFPANTNDLATTSKKNPILSYLTYLLYFLFWLTCYVIAIELKFGIVFLLFSALIGIYFNTRTGPKKPNEISAYSVFNENCHSIEGTLNAEQFDREIRYGPTGVR